MCLGGDSSLFREKWASLGIKTKASCRTEASQGGLHSKSERVPHSWKFEKVTSINREFPEQPCNLISVLSLLLSSCMNWGKCLKLSESLPWKLLVVSITNVCEMLVTMSTWSFTWLELQSWKDSPVWTEEHPHSDHRWSQTMECLLVSKEGRTQKQVEHETPPTLIAFGSVPDIL